ncbi:MAG: hypothetical protein SRB1_00606 [Desulfobacteraceae bacterium Eth-SRB1]|nr:MAG: hypothetical protein SRB1_00606 [Desulfobacteraceae bacterium Eth-SRB1]
MNRKKAFLEAMMTFFGIFVLLAGCGGGGGGGIFGSSSVMSVISGTVSDGPIANARVSLDLNHDGKYNPGEPFGITNADGEYRIEYILDPGTEYMIVVEGSTALGTSDPVDNPGVSLEFTMFFPLTSAGSRSSAPSASSYQVNATPDTFKDYLTELNEKVVGGIDNINVTNIIGNTDGSVTLFQTCILDDGTNSNKTNLQAVAANVGEIIDAENTRKDLESVGDDLGIPSGSALDFTDGTQDLSDSLAYQGKTVSVIGDMVVSTPLNDATAEDVILTNINSAGIDQILTFTVEPSSLTGYEVSVTPYQSILEIPEFSGIRDNGDVVVLGADVTAKDSGVKKTDQSLTCSVTSDPDNSFTGLVYYYFDGTVWINSGAVSADMNIWTAPFVIVKTNNITEKTLTIEGLSQLDRPTVIIKGYMDSDPAEGVMTLDAFTVVPASDTVTVKIPAGFVISEVVVVDSDLSNVSADGMPSLSLPVTDSEEITISDGATEMILDETLYSILKDGSLDFPGVRGYIDTKIVYSGIEMFLGLNIDNDVKDIITENIDRYLEDIDPVFYSGSEDLSGVTIDADNHTIEVLPVETNAEISVKWSFAPNSVERVYTKNSTDVTKTGSTCSSTCTFSNASENLTNMIFEESVKEYTNNIQTLSASYEGSAVYNRSTNSLESSKFYQKRSETYITTMKTDTLNGMATMENDTLSFNGSYSFYLESYGAVAGSVNIKNATCAKGYDEEDTLRNNNNIKDANALFSTTSGCTPPVPNPEWLKGIWNGTFTDSCGENDGQMTMTVTDTNATWWGYPDYGTTVSISDSTVTFMNDGSTWSVGQISEDHTRIEGNWSYDDCNGAYHLTKQ